MKVIISNSKLVFVSQPTDIDVENYLSAIGTDVNKAAILDFVKVLKVNNIWNKLDHIIIPACGAVDISKAMIDLKSCSIAHSGGTGATIKVGEGLNIANMSEPLSLEGLYSNKNTYIALLFKQNNYAIEKNSILVANNAGYPYSGSICVDKSFNSIYYYYKNTWVADINSANKLGSYMQAGGSIQIASFDDISVIGHSVSYSKITETRSPDEVSGNLTFGCWEYFYDYSKNMMPINTDLCYTSIITGKQPMSQDDMEIMHNALNVLKDNLI